MGATQSRKTVEKPQEIGEFRKLGFSEHYDMPETPMKRKPTDQKFIFTFAAVIVILIPFLIYTLAHSDLMRLIHGYDNCGNVCGQMNKKYENIECSGRDKTDFPYLNIIQKSADPFSGRLDTINDEECVHTCPSNQSVFNRCVGTSSSNTPHMNEDSDFTTILTKMAMDVENNIGSIVAMVCVGILMTAGILLLFRYYTSYIVWFMLIGSYIALICLTFFFWFAKAKAADKNEGGNKMKQTEGILSFFAYFFTIIVIIFGIMLVCLLKRIRLVIHLMQESIRVVFRIPLILAEPMLTFIAQLVLIIYMYFTLLSMMTMGDLKLVNFHHYDYVPNTLQLFTLFYHIFVCIWMAQFIIGCQHMIISGAVSTAYFAGTDHVLESPIYNSFYNLFKFHMGTVAFGSLILTIVAVVKALIRSMINNKSLRALVECCLGSIEDFLKYLSKNAYILTAIHGQPFYKSGKRAVSLLADNAISAIAVNSVGDFVMCMAKMLIVLIVVGFGILIKDDSVEYFWLTIFIGALITAIMVDCVFAVFETAVDTIFICFCEDNCMNDGVTHPYYMSVNLKKYMEDAKKVYKDKN